MGRGRRGSTRLLVLATLVGLSFALDPGLPGGEDVAVERPVVFTTWRILGVEDGLPDASIRSVRVVGDEVWVGTDGGLGLLRDHGWGVWTADDGLPGAPISAIDEEPGTGDMWLGTLGGGLVRFTAGRFDRFTQFDSGLAGDQVFAVVAAEERIWVATNGGISSLEPATGSWDLHVEPTVGVAAGRGAAARSCP